MLGKELLQEDQSKEILQNPEQICVVTATFYPLFKTGISEEEIAQRKTFPT